MRFVLLASLASLAGCPDPSASTPQPDAHFASEHDVWSAFASVELPYVIAFAATPDPRAPRACPAVTKQSNEDYLVRGDGCIDANGIGYNGEVAISIRPSAASAVMKFRYSRFEVVAPASSVIVDGEIDAETRASDCGYPGPSPLRTTGLSVTASGAGLETFGGYFPGAGQTVSLRFHDYEYGWDLHCDPAAIDTTGRIELDGIGAFAVTSHREDGDACDREADSGTTELIGSDRVILEHAGSAACDDCVDYHVDGGTSGKLCGPPTQT
jgi:hypothetical protein